MIADIRGPWKAQKNSWSDTEVTDFDGSVVCTLHLSDEDCTEENQHEMEIKQSKIAARIQAAPQMFNALQHVKAWAQANRQKSATLNLDMIESALIRATEGNGK